MQTVSSHNCGNYSKIYSFCFHGFWFKCSPPGCFYGWGLLFVFIDMSANLQPIPLGLIGIKPYVDIKIETGTIPTNEAGTESIYQNDAFVSPPSVFVDGVLLTYVVAIDRRYIEYDAETKTITTKNGIFQIGEYVQIFL